MKWTKKLAERIVAEMMGVLPYNINVMDADGYIIASGEQGRVGTIHEGARRVLDSGQIYEATTAELGMQPGVNEPIVVGGKLVGVLGITGEPEQVRPFGRLMRVTVALLIEQAMASQREQDDREQRVRFYQELTSRKEPYDPAFVERAKGYRLDLARRSRVILVQGPWPEQRMREAGLRSIPLWKLAQDKTVCFLNDPGRTDLLLEQLIQSEAIEAVGVGEDEPLAALSLEQATAALELGSKLAPDRIIHTYSELRFLIHLTSPLRQEQGAIAPLFGPTEKAADLLQTLQMYIAENGDVSRTAQRLHIHRNTLHYRLDRIRQLTGKDPRSLLDLVELLCGLVWR